MQKADKGNTIVILYKYSYLKSVETLLKDSSKFKNIPDKDLNYIVNSDKRATDYLEKLQSMKKRVIRVKTQSMKKSITN